MCLLLLVTAATCFSFSAVAEPASIESALDEYNVVWTTQSENAGGSMPVSGYDIGLNVWVENDELFFYIGRAGCRDENGALLKPGRVRVRMTPNPFENGFRQELKLRQGYVEIEGTGETGGRLRLWVESDRPVIHLEADFRRLTSVEAVYENWRLEDRVLPDDGSRGARALSMITFDAYPGEILQRKDTVEVAGDRVTFFHRIEGRSFLYDFTVAQQKLEAADDRLWNPLENLTWGGVMLGEHFSFAGETQGTYASTQYKGWRLESDEPATSHHLRVAMHTDQSKKVHGWQSNAYRLANDTAVPQDAWEAHQAWWQQFWERSRILINMGKGEEDAGWRVGRNYNLFRSMLACNRRGSEPTVFNGGLFTFDPVYVNGVEYTPDYRQWGASFHAQNQRLIYWPMLKSGDFDLMQPLFEQYRQGLANATARVRVYWGHDGACFVEAPGPHLLPGPAVYGFVEGGRRGRPQTLAPGVQVNRYVGYIFQSQLEYAWMMLQYYRYSGIDIAPYLPYIKQAVIFYDEHYRWQRVQRGEQPLTVDGKLEIYPSNALESFYNARNPAEAVAGLTRVLDELIALPELSTQSELGRWRSIRKTLPALPTAERDGKIIMRPAENKDHGLFLSPEMYPLFPYDLYGLGKPNLEVMLDTWDSIPANQREGYKSWEQMVIHAARLGHTEHATRLIQRKLGNGNQRFPAFFPVGHDWQPDHNWGGSGMIGLQEMLLQAIDGELRLLPAWPDEWDVDFKLHAPGRTTVECRVLGGKIVDFKVEPESRRSDIESPDIVVP